MQKLDREGKIEAQGKSKTETEEGMSRVPQRPGCTNLMDRGDRRGTGRDDWDWDRGWDW